MFATSHVAGVLNISSKHNVILKTRINMCAYVTSYQVGWIRNSEKIT